MAPPRQSSETLFGFETDGGDRLGFMAVQQALRIGNPHYYGCQKKFPETGMTNPENPKPALADALAVALSAANDNPDRF
eukprot:gene17222-23544_t